MSNNLNESKSEEPSHNMEGNYVILMETNGEEYESWYYFIKVEGNEDSLHHLQSQLEKIDWYILDELSTFDLDLDNPVSAQTAKQMTKIDLNHYSFHRKFDGKLQKIDFDFKKKDGNETKICKVFDLLGFGQIEDFIDDEDIDEEDLTSSSEVSTDDESLSSSEEEDDEDEDDDDYEDEKPKKTERLPPSVLRKKGNKK